MQKPLIGMATACLGLLTLAGPIQAQELPSARFAYVGSWSSLSLFNNFEKPFWGEHLAEASNGQITADVTTFDQMGLKGAEVFKLLSQGVYDIGSTVGDYTVADAPELAGMDMPMLAPDVATAKKIVEAYRPVLDGILSERFGGAKLIAAVPYPSQVVFCNGKIDGLADLEGKKIRASGRTTAKFLDAVGAEGVTLAFSEVPGALQRGVIDCAVTGSLSGYSANWYEVSDTFYPLPAGGWDYVITAMNGDKWDSLDPRVQDWLMRQVQEHYTKPVWENAKTKTQQGIACLTGHGDCDHGKPGDMTLVEPTQADVKLARQKLESTVIPSWASTVDEQAVKRWNQTIGEVTGLTAKAQ